jgi:2,4-dienoyl-CoA reductase-like NADH-dependent reductase (Old Yellow Enzyme family)
MKYPHLFEPIKLNGLELKNRIVFPAMGTGFTDMGHVTKVLIDYHVARVKGGCGLNITEACSVHGPSAPRDLLLQIWDDEFIPGFKELTKAIHCAGGKACLQLWQGGPSAGLADPNSLCVIPSDINA